MLDIDNEEELIKKIGGKFKLTSLIQKRMVELHRPGARALVKVDDKRDLLRIVIQEVLQDKIQLAPREEVSYSLEEEKLLIEREQQKLQAQKQLTPEEEEQAAPTPEIYGSDIKKIKEQRIRELAELLNPNKK